LIDLARTRRTGSIAAVDFALHSGRLQTVDLSGNFFAAGPIPLWAEQLLRTDDDHHVITINISSGGGSEQSSARGWFVRVGFATDGDVAACIGRIKVDANAFDCTSLCAPRYGGARCSTCIGCATGLMCNHGFAAASSAAKCMLPPDMRAAYPLTTTALNLTHAKLGGVVPDLTVFPLLTAADLSGNPELAVDNPTPWAWALGAGAGAGAEKGGGGRQLLQWGTASLDVSESTGWNGGQVCRDGLLPCGGTCRERCCLPRTDPTCTACGVRSSFVIFFFSFALKGDSH
jgi:hypothetical protein